jgi:hypothetical protein
MIYFLFVRPANKPSCGFTTNPSRFNIVPKRIPRCAVVAMVRRSENRTIHFILNCILQDLNLNWAGFSNNSTGMTDAMENSRNEE